MARKRTNQEPPEDKPEIVIPEAEKKRAKGLHAAIRAANKAYKEWSSDFMTDSLERLYAGHQWDERTERDEERYVINLVFPTIETKIPTLFLNNPKVQIKPRPARSDEPGSNVDDRARLLMDTAQTFISNPKTHFMSSIYLCLKESFYRFGVAYVGYSADVIDNPDAGKAINKEDSDDPLMDAEGKPVYQPERIITEESVYVERIPAHQFRVSLIDDNSTDRCDWVGFYRWVHYSDLYAHPVYGKKAAAIKPQGRMKKAYGPDLGPGDDGEHLEIPSDGETLTGSGAGSGSGAYGDGSGSSSGSGVGSGAAKDAKNKKAGMCKLWFLWKIREKRHIIVPDEGEVIFLDEPFKTLPIADIRLHQLLDQFYPMPPVWTWRHPQAELNETREMMRTHRRRFTRRYMYRDGAIDEPELEKLESSVDGTMIKTNVPPTEAIIPVPDAELGRTVAMSIPNSKDDFANISSVGGDQRGTPQSETATQATIINQNQERRDAFYKQLVGAFVSDIVKIMLKIIVEKMALPMWIKVNTDQYRDPAKQQPVMQTITVQDPATGQPVQQIVPVDPLQVETQRVQSAWQLIVAADIEGEFDYDVEVDIESMAPSSEAVRRDQWSQVLQLFSNPTILAVMVTSDMILRRTLSMYGITSDADVAQIRFAMGTVLQGLQQQAMGATAPGGGTGAPSGPSAGPPRGQLNPGRPSPSVVNFNTQRTTGQR